MKIPEQPENSIRIMLELKEKAPRLDTILLAEVKNKVKNLELKHISRAKFKALFDEKRIQIKGQPARPSSSIAKGITYIDILGFSEKE